MDKYKIVGKLRQLFFGSMAVIMSAGGVVATNMANAFAADQSLDNNVGVAARKLQYDDTESYVSKNVNKKVVTSEADKSTKEIKNDLIETGYSIRLKQLIAEQSKIPKDCTIDTLWAKYKDAFIAQYSTIVKLYNTSDDADYYVANLSSAKINGMGSIYDAAFVKGTNNANPDVIKDIKFDKTTGLAYIPKSLETILTARLLQFPQNGPSGKMPTEQIIRQANTRPNSMSCSYQNNTPIFFLKALMHHRQILLLQMPVVLSKEITHRSSYSPSRQSYKILLKFCLELHETPAQFQIFHALQQAVSRPSQPPDSHNSKSPSHLSLFPALQIHLPIGKIKSYRPNPSFNKFSNFMAS